MLKAGVERAEQGWAALASCRELGYKVKDESVIKVDDKET